MKLFASDIDNTLIPQKESLNREYIEKLKQILAKVGDIKIAYITGRKLSLALEALTVLPHPDFISPEVGNSIYYFDGLSYKKMEEYEQHLEDSGYNREKIANKIKDAKGLSIQERDVQTKFKLSYYLDLDYEKTLFKIKKVLKQDPVKVVYSVDIVKGLGLVDIIPIRGGKEGALKFLANRVKADNNQIIYAGDSGNDFDALTAGFNGILVGNASDDLKKILSKKKFNVYTAKGNFSSGVVEGIKYFFKTK